MSVLHCPVCPHGAALPEGTTTCSICGSDLDVLARLGRVRASLDAAAAIVPVPIVAPRRLGWLAAGCILGGAVLGGVIAATFIGVTRPATATQTATAPVTIADPPAPVATTTQTAPDSLDVLTTRLTRVDGVKVDRRGGRVVVGFPDGMFRRGSTRLQASTRALIERVASELWRDGGALRIDVIGHTDAATVRAGAQWSDNWMLGLSRAEAVAVVLHRAGPSGVGVANIHVASAGESVPELETETGARRTVVIAATLAPAR